MALIGTGEDLACRAWKAEAICTRRVTGVYDDGLVEADLGRALQDAHEGSLAVAGGEGRALGPVDEGLAIGPGAVADVLALVVGA
jgi:hypothetical protein